MWLSAGSATQKSPLFTHPIGHYTAVVWAETEYVGCGVINYTTDNQYQMGSRVVEITATFEYYFPHLPTSFWVYSKTFVQI